MKSQTKEYETSGQMTLIMKMDCIYHIVNTVPPTGVDEIQSQSNRPIITTKPFSNGISEFEFLEGSILSESTISYFLIFPFHRPSPNNTKFHFYIKYQQIYYIEVNINLCIRSISSLFNCLTNIIQLTQHPQ